MKKITELQKFQALLRTFEIKVTVWHNPHYLCGSAIKAGAVSSYQICDTDFYFSKTGRFLGHATSQANSFKLRGTKLWK